MGVISSRINDEDERLLKRAGINLSELFRVAAHERALQLRRERALSWLAQHTLDVGTRSEDVVREARDA